MKVRKSRTKALQAFQPLHLPRWYLIDKNLALFDLQWLDSHLVRPFNIYNFLLNFIKIALIVHAPSRKFNISIKKLSSLISMQLVSAEIKRNIKVC